MSNSEKIFHNEGHPERFKELHGEEKRDEGDRGDQEEKRGNQRGESKLGSNQFPMCSPQYGPLRDVHGITQRREEGGRRQRWPGGEKGKSKEERQIQPVVSSLSVLHSPEHTKRFTELGREEKGRGEEIEVTLWRKRRSKRWREQSSQ